MTGNHVGWCTGQANAQDGRGRTKITVASSRLFRPCQAPASAKAPEATASLPFLSASESTGKPKVAVCEKPKQEETKPGAGAARLPGEQSRRISTGLLEDLLGSSSSFFLESGSSSSKGQGPSPEPRAEGFLSAPGFLRGCLQPGQPFSVRKRVLSHRPGMSTLRPKSPRDAVHRMAEPTPTPSLSSAPPCSFYSAGSCSPCLNKVLRQEAG